MKFLGFALLFVMAAGLVIAMAVGVAIQLVWYGFLALLVVTGVTFVMNKLRGPKRTERLEAPPDAEQLPR
jgi:hypothetical protein